MLIGTVAGFLTSLSSLPQLIKIFRTEDVSGISLGSYLILLVALVLWVIYGRSTRNNTIILWNLVTLSLVVVIITALCWKRHRFRRRHKDKQPQKKL